MNGKSINFMSGATYQCHVCGKKFLPGTQPDGLPNGVGMIMENGKTLIFCTECVKSLGSKRKKGINEILAKAIERANK